MAWVGLSLGLVSAGFAILGATDALRHPIALDQLPIIAILLAATFGVWGAAFVGRWLLARTINPNRNYPDRPGIMPGAPKPFKLGPVPHVGAVAVDALSLQPAAPSAPAPATTRPLIAYEAKPRQLEPGGWLTVQLLELRHPPRCSCCLSPTQSFRRYSCGPLATVPIPLCDRCGKFYKGERAWILLVAGIIGAAAGIFGAAALSLPTPGVVVVTLISTAAALIVGVYVASLRAVPACSSRFSAVQNTVRIRFRNPAYVHALLEAGRVV